MTDFYQQAGPCGLAIVILGLIAVYAAVRGLILTILVQKQGWAAGTVLAGILAEAVKADPQERSFVINSLMQARLKGIYGAMYFLKLCAAVGPLLGLLGTVLGMVDVFSTIAERSYPEPSMLAGGIWQALITTVMGLTLAIPSLLLHYVFLLQLRRCRNRLSLKASRLQD